MNWASSRFYTDYCITRMMRDFDLIDENKESNTTIKAHEDNTEQFE